MNFTYFKEKNLLINHQEDFFNNSFYYGMNSEISIFSNSKSRFSSIEVVVISGDPLR